MKSTALFLLLSVASILTVVGNEHFSQTLAVSGQEHGPTAKCKQWCAPKGHEDEARPPEGVPVVDLQGHRRALVYKVGPTVWPET